MEVFYAADRIPVHSCMMLDRREKALAFPTRDLVLGFCSQCGFVSNVLFDSSVQKYTVGYEEQQSFSPRFRSFQSDLVAGLIERYDLVGKDIVEIGCGKGDFLVELCEVGNNRGVGIDPACDPERMEKRGGGRVRFLAELYSDRHAELPCDFLCCRHTLEHIHPVGDFIFKIRRVVDNNKETIIFFEVPDAERVLREQAFWDIYYEHCSYFSLGSLARLFRKNCFDVIELAKDFDDQYLLIVARPVVGPTHSCLPEEDDLRMITEEAAAFTPRTQAGITDLRARITALREAGKHIAIWGSGSKCVSFLSALGDRDGIDAVVDINPHRHAKFLAGSGTQVVSPEVLLKDPIDVILVMNPIYRAEIQDQLEEMGVAAELICL